MPEAAATAGGLFPKTRWTLIASSRESPEARERALAELLRVYWRPLYVYVRHKGLKPEDAQDAVQDLLVRLVEKDFLDRLAPERGKLRGYLKAAADHFLVNRHEKASAAKRGGGKADVPLDFAAAERTIADPSPGPEESYRQEWAAQVMERALGKLREEFERGERKGPFDVVKTFFQPGEPPSYKEIAKRHAMSVPQLKAFLHRARVRFRELVRAEVLDTVSSEADADAEMKELVAALSA